MIESLLTYMMFIPVVIVFSLFIGLLCVIYTVIICPKTYRTNINYLHIDNEGHRTSGGSWQESPWKWLAIKRAKEWISDDPDIFEAFVEDISDEEFNYDTCSGKIVWEWKKEKYSHPNGK